MIQGDRLRLSRQKRGLSQRELAERVGKSQGYIGDIEGGKRKAITTETLVRLCHELQVSADYLLGLEDELEAELLAAVAS